MNDRREKDTDEYLMKYLEEKFANQSRSSMYMKEDIKAIKQDVADQTAKIECIKESFDKKYVTKGAIRLVWGTIVAMGGAISFWLKLK